MSKSVIETDRDGGEEYVRVNLKDLSCPVCFEVKLDMLAPPLCGHLICRDCYTGIHAQLERQNGGYLSPHLRNAAKCPSCNGPGNWQPVRAINLIAGRIPVRCQNDCGAERLTMQSYPAHLDACPRVLVPCPHPGCGWQGVRAELAAHDAACIEAMVECQHCTVDVHRGALAMHEATCAYQGVSCVECRVSMSKWRIPIHACGNGARAVPPAARDEQPAARDEQPAARDEQPAARDEQPANAQNWDQFPDDEERKENDVLALESNSWERANLVPGGARIRCGTCARWHGSVCLGCGYSNAETAECRSDVASARALHCLTCNRYRAVRPRTNPPQDTCRSCGTYSWRSARTRDRIAYNTAIHCSTCDMWSSCALFDLDEQDVQDHQDVHAGPISMLREIGRRVVANEISPELGVAMADRIDQTAERALRRVAGYGQIGADGIPVAPVERLLDDSDGDLDIYE